MGAEMRGFLSGMVWGGATIGVGLAALSLMSPVAPRPDLASQAPAGAAMVPDAGPDAGADAGVQTRMPKTRDADIAEAAPSVLEPGSDAPDGTAPETAPGQAPQVAAAPEGPDVPAESAAVDGPEADGAAATAAAPRPASPEAPGGESAPEALEALAQPQVEGSPGVPAAAQARSVPSVPETGDAPERVAALPELGTQSRAEAAPEMPAAPEAAPRGSDAPEARGAAADPGEAPQVPQPAPAPPQVAGAPGAIAQPAEEDRPTVLPTVPEPQEREETRPEAGAPKVAALPQAGDGEGGLRPSIGQRVVPLTERGNAEPEAGTEAGAETGADAPARPPLDRYAAPAGNPEGKPLMAIVLIDDGAAIGHEALAEFPYPLTFAIDPTAPDAAEKMARHRDAGFEVVAMFNLPREGRPQDAEVALSAGFDRLPEALAVMEGTGTGVQGNRKMSDQVAAFAGSTGRGLITLGNGLNTMQKLALREGVPSAAVFRDFDGAGQTPTVMRRFLDQAAFRAGQEGAVIMLGRVRPDTVSSLLIWALQDRVSRVAMVPVSAVLRGSVAGE